MQKKLIALAIAGLSSAAFAQSNVTVYGVADATFEIAKATGAATSGADRGSFTRVNSNSSHIGFKGSEALGNGLTAVFQVETGVSLDNNSNALSTAFLARDTFVGLAGGFGTVVLGTLTGPTRGLGARMDMNSGATGPGANSSILGKPVGGSGAGILDTRLGNTIAYVSPTFSGFNAVIGFSSGENKTIDSTVDASKLNTKAWDLGLNYVNGPIDVGYAHADVRVGNTDAANTGYTFGTTAGATTTGVSGGLGLVGNTNALGVYANTWRNDRLAGAYTFTGGHKVVLLWDKANVNLTAGNKLTRTTWGIGGKFMVTPAGGLIAQYYDARKYKLNGSAATDSGAKLWEIGYEHSLSKRTILKASYSELKNSAAAQYDFNVGAVAGSGASTQFGAGADPKVLAVGIRHAF